MAAIEAVSRLHIHPHKGDSAIDIRTVRLPPARDPRKPKIRTASDSESDSVSEDSELIPYDPMDHRAPVHKIKVWMAYINLLRSMFGPGMMAMPLVISQMGIVIGPIMTLATGFLIVFTHNMLLESLYDVARQLRIPYISYRYGFRIALLHGPSIFHGLGHQGPKIIAIFMLASQLGILTVCVIFTTDGFRDLLDLQNRETALLILLFPYLLMQFFMSNLLIVSYVAMLGNFLNLAGMILMSKHMLVAQLGVVTAATNLMGVLFGFGSLLFVLSAVGVILSLDKSLEHPDKLRGTYGVLNVGILGPTVIAVIFGSLGYFAFGTMEENVLRSLPFDEDSAMATIAIYSISVAFTYPLQCHPAVMIIIEVIKYHYTYGPDDSPSAKILNITRDISRTMLVLSSFLISYLVPFQGPFVAFVGNLCTSMLALVFPALMDICLRYPSNYGVMNYRLYVDLFILSLGLISLVFGVYFCSGLIYVRILSKNAANFSGFF